MADEIENEIEEVEEEVETPEDETEEETDEVISAEEAKQIRAALAKANEEAKKYRLERNTLRKELESEDERKEREIREAVQGEVEGKWKGRLVQTEARIALVEAGAVGDVNRVLRLVNINDVSLNEDGDLEGLEDQIKTLKKDYPEFFDKKTSAPKDVDKGDKRPAKTGKSSAQLIAERLGR